MSIFTWFTGRKPALTQEQLQRRECLAAASTLGERPLQQQRFVVLDLETSGLNMRRDMVLSIGAVVIENAAIDLSQQFECTLQRHDHRASASTLIHGIAPSEIVNGEDPAQALLAFMEFVGDSPLLAFHAEFDQRMLARALKQSLGYRLQHTFVDVAEIAPLLCPKAKPTGHGLDAWTHGRMDAAFWPAGAAAPSRQRRCIGDGRTGTYFTQQGTPTRPRQPAVAAATTQQPTP